MTKPIGALAPTSREDVWKEAVLDQCAVVHSAFYEDDPKKTLDTIIDWNVMIALDPLVSSDAAALIAKGAEDMRERVETLAKKEVSDWEILRDISIAREESALIESTNILAINRLIEAIRAIPLTHTNTEAICKGETP